MSNIAETDRIYSWADLAPLRADSEWWRAAFRNGVRAMADAARQAQAAGETLGEVTVKIEPRADKEGRLEVHWVWSYAQ